MKQKLCENYLFFSVKNQLTEEKNPVKILENNVIRNSVFFKTNNNVKYTKY